MPGHKPPASLQVASQRAVAQLIRRLTCDRSVGVAELQPAVDHIHALLPPQLQAAVCHTLLHHSNKVVFPELLNHKYLYMCSQLHAEYLWLNDDQHLMTSLKKVNGKHIKTLKMTGAHGQLDLDLHGNIYDFQQVVKHEPFYHFIQTLKNLTVLRCSKMCNNYVLQLLSMYCPHLEELDLDMCSDVDDEGLFHLAGHIPTVDTYAKMQRGVPITSTSVCTKLRRVNLEYTMACTASAVILLYLCKYIEELDICPDVNIGDVFTSLHGSNPERYEDVTSQYSLKFLNTYMELDENVLALIVRTCPKLEKVTLRCNGIERKDKNFLANLLAVQVKHLNVMNCNLQALLWYLEQKGSILTHLTIQILTMAPLSLSFTRTHLQKVIVYCTNLKSFTLKLNNSPIQPNVPYSAFGSQLRHFLSLEQLILEGTSVLSEDLNILVSKCTNLKELHILIHNLDILDDQVLSDLLASGSLRHLTTLFLHRPMLTLAGLRKLLDECPHLHTVGPLSSWAISKKDREALAKEIRDKNWDLNVESPEMMHMYIL